jgi:hypothetical protein
MRALIYQMICLVPLLLQLVDELFAKYADPATGKVRVYIRQLNTFVS